MADGKTCDTVEAVILRIETDTAICGWGEVCPTPRYLPAYAREVAPALEELAPAQIDAKPVGPEAVMARVDKHFCGHPYAKSAIDIALWDITAKAAGLPLYVLLGGRRQADMQLYYSITCTAPERMAEIAVEAQSRGVSQFQAKLGADRDRQTDVARLHQIRKAIGPGPLIFGNWNCGCTQLDAIRVGRALEHLDIILEQPRSTLAECNAVRASTGLPMKIDECAYDTGSLLAAHRSGILDAVALKLSKFGGLSKTRQARDLCLFLGAGICVEDTWGSDITTAASLHLGVSTEPDRLLNVCDLFGYVSPRLDSRIPQRKCGRIEPPEGNALGVSSDLDLLGTPNLVLD